MRIILPILLTAAGAAQDLSIQNEHLQVRYTPASFSVSVNPTAKPFADGALREQGGSATVRRATDPIFGNGQMIEILYANGNSDRFLVFPKLPFVLFRTALHNGTAAIQVTEKIRPLIFTAALSEPLKILGTGGLTDPDKAQGSYMWTAVADPHTRKGIVAGWITSDRGSGVIFPETTTGRLRLNPQIDYGKLRIKPGQTETLETFALGYFDDARIGLESWASTVASVYQIKLRPQPDGYCTWYHARASNEKDLPVQTRFAAENLEPYGLRFIQIDDGWQAGIKTNGPKKNFTQVDPEGPYPSGMKVTADRIRARGFIPGIWFMPFAANFADPWFRDHQDWFARREDGKPYDVFWGGTSLDTTHPGAREYVRGIVNRIANDWGFDYFKMDGLWTGSATEMQYVNDAYKDDHIGNAVLHDPDKTNVEMYRDALKLVRDAAGPNVFFLGCNTPQNMRVYGGSFGLVDAMRIGPDNGVTWEQLLRGPKYGSRNYFLHRRVWYNDPDPLYVRDKLPLNQARLISSWVAVSGQLSVSSEAYAELPPDRLDLLKRTLPSHHFDARPVDLFSRKIPRMWRVTGNNRDVIGIFNWTTEPQEIDEPFDATTEYAAFEYWTNSLLPPVRDRLKITLPGATAAVLAIRPVSDHPQIISTSRHITQGLIDVTAEKWNPSTSELEGAGKVVGRDPYEIRILTHGKRGPWKLTAVSAPPDVTIDTKTETDLLRVTLRSETSREVRWKARFTSR